MATGHELAAAWGETHRPQYRMTLTDDAGTPLTPRSGSVHSDAFKVTTQPNPPAGWKPYMTAPSGYRGRFDLSSCHTEQGEQTVRLVDARTHGDNARRWVTAFLGNDDGYNLLKHAIAHIEESLDGGDTWHDYFTGRVAYEETPDVYETGPYFDLVVQDHRVEEYRKVFVGAPHRSLTYARMAPVWPIGVPQMRTTLPTAPGWLGFTGWDGQIAIPPARATAFTSGGKWFLDVPLPASQPGQLKSEYQRLFLTESAAAAADPLTSTSPLAKAIGAQICTTLRVYIRALGATTWKKLAVCPTKTYGFGSGKYYGYDGATNESALWINEQGYLKIIGVVPYPPSHPDYLSLTHATTYEVQLVDEGKPRPESPLLIDDVSPMTLIKDMAEGKFSLLDVNGDVVQPAIPVDDTLFVDDGTSVRFMVKEPADFQEFLERSVLRTSRRAVRVGRDGVVRPFSTSLESVTASAVGGVPASLDEIPQSLITAAEWKYGRELWTGVKVVAKKYGWAAEVLTQLKLDEDKQGLKSAPACGILEQEVEEIYIGARAAQSGDEPETVEAPGVRVPWSGAGFDPSMAGSLYPSIPPLDSGVFLGPLERIARHFLNWFEDGAAFMHLTCRRAGVVEDIEQGDWVVVNADAVPNASSNQRGGQRLGIVVERNDNGPLVELVVQDAGPNQSPTAPNLGNASTVSDGDGIYPYVPFTLNASADPIEVQFALTDDSVTTRPIDTDPVWEHLGDFSEDGNAVMRAKFDGLRVWFRARTLRKRTHALPSGWVYADNDYVTVGGTPRATGAVITLDGDVPSVTVYPNAYALGLRVFYEVHDPADTPGMTAYIDVEATTDPIELPVTVAEGEAVTVWVRPYTGWSGSAVSGTAGSDAPAYLEREPPGVVGPAGSDGTSIVWQGSAASHPASPQNGWAYRNTTDNTVYIYQGGSWHQMVFDGVSIRWRGEAASPPSSPQENDAYRDTDDGIVYIYKTGAWVMMVSDGSDGADGADGADGLSVFITYHDSPLTSTPAAPTGDGTTGGWHTDATPAVVWMSQKRALTASAGTWGAPIPMRGHDGADGAAGVAGADGASIVWQGSAASHPGSPQNGWAYYNTTDKKSYVYQDGAWYQMTVDGTDGQDGADGNDGLSVTWRGEFAEPPADPSLNDVYRDTDNGIIYIWTGSAWEVMVVDGSDGVDGAPGADGLSVYVTYHDNPLDSPPATPTGSGTSGGWHTSATSAVVWMSQKRALTSSSGTWGTPIPIKGANGADGVDGFSIDWRGSFASHPSSPQRGWAYYNTTDKKSYIRQDGTWYQMTIDGVDGAAGQDGLSVTWRGEMASPPADPEVNHVYRDTDNGVIYIWSGTAWEVMVLDGDDGAEGAPGADGLSVFITYHDNPLDSPPATPTGSGTAGGWHTTPTSAVVWMSQKRGLTASGGGWGTPIPIKGADGAPGSNGADGVDGSDGISIDWRGSFASHPASPQRGWAYYNTTDKKSYIRQSGTWYQMTVDGVDGANGSDGLSIRWRGESSSPPSSPQENDVYRDLDNGFVYIYNGSAWELMVLDGSDGADGADGADGLSVFVTYHTNPVNKTPAAPTGSGNSGGWSTAATAEARWISQKRAATASSGTWGAPIPIKGGDAGHSMTEVFGALPPGLSTETGASIVTLDGASGGSVLQLSGQPVEWNPGLARAVPFVNGPLYKVAVRYRLTVDNAKTNSFGVSVLDKDGLLLTSFSLIAANDNDSVGEGWITAVGWLKGTGARKTEATDPLSPSGTGEVNGAYLTPWFLANWSTAGTQVTQLDYFSITRVDDELAGAIQAASTAYADLQKTLAQAYADGLITDEEAARIAADTATYNSAVSYAESVGADVENFADYVARRSYKPTVRVVVQTVAGVTTLYMLINDPLLRTHSVEWQSRSGGGSLPGVYSTAWTTASGVYGSNPDITRARDFVFPTGMDSEIHWVVRYYDQDGVSKVMQGVVPYASLQPVNKTIRIPFSDFMPQANTFSYNTVNGYLSPGSTIPTGNYTGGVVFPPGVTLTKMTANFYLGVGSASATLELRRAENSGATPLMANVAATTGILGSWQQRSDTMSEVTNHTYFLRLALSQGGGAVTDARFMWVEFEYTTPSYDKTY